MRSVRDQPEEGKHRTEVTEVTEEGKSCFEQLFSSSRTGGSRNVGEPTYLNPSASPSVTSVRCFYRDAILARKPAASPRLS
jgi:hypothetical protein